MGNCLVTKLKESVDNNSLLRINELKVTYKNALEGGNRSITLLGDFSIIDLRIIDGTGSFSAEGVVTETKISRSYMEDGRSIFSFYIVSPNGCSVGYSNKYDIYSVLTSGSAASINADDLLLLLNSGKLGHRIGYNVIGDLDVSSLPSDAELSVGNIYISGEDLHGDMTPFLSRFTNCIYKFFLNNRCTADMSQMPDECPFLFGSNMPLSWKTERDNQYKIISFVYGNINFGDDLDAMLINQAKCVARTDIESEYMAISVSGTRTSASDAAITTLKNKGYRVTINNVVQ